MSALGVAEYADLRSRDNPALLLRAHRVLDFIAVAARTDIAGDHHRRLRRLVLPAQSAISAIAPRLAWPAPRRIAELRRPIRIGAPGRQPSSIKPSATSVSPSRYSARNRRADFRVPVRALHQVEAREIWKLDAFMKDQRGLEPAIGQEQPVGELRQLVAVFGHHVLLCSCPGEDIRARRTRKIASQPSKLAVQRRRRRVHGFARFFRALRKTRQMCPQSAPISLRN